VTAVHHFFSNDTVYDLYGIRVTGDHLVLMADKLIPVRDHQDAVPIQPSMLQWFQGGVELWCLTTTTRRIPCRGLRQTILFADWEEIDEKDEDALRAWYAGVWTELNGAPPSAPPPEHVLDAEAGLSPDCRVACQDIRGNLIYKPLKEVAVGSIVFDTPTTTTIVVGKVRIAGDQSTDSIHLESTQGPQIVSCATWIRDSQMWNPAAIGRTATDQHVFEWQHLYTKSGSFLLDGFWKVRDASDVGLENLRPLVESIVLAGAANRI